MSDFMLTGEVETRVFDFFRVLHALKLEQKGIQFGPKSVIHKATSAGYVPSSIVGRGTLLLRRQTAVEHMTYVAELLRSGGFAKLYGEDIVMGWVEYAGESDCGCPIFKGSPNSKVGLSSIEEATMCIHGEVED